MNYSDPYKKYNLGERDDSVLFLFSVLFLSLINEDKEPYFFKSDME